MRKILFLLGLLASSSVCFGQTSAITATITDTDGTAWSSGPYTIQLVNSSGQPIAAGGAYRIDTGATITNSFSGTLDGSGALSVTLTTTSNINPAGTKWKFGICPNTIPAVCGGTSLTITASGSLSSQLSASILPPRIGGGPGTQAYADVEVAATPNNSYLNVGSLAGLRCYGSSWAACGGAGTGLPTATAAGQVPTATGAGTTYTAQADAPSSSIFYIASNCRGLTNCLAWVDDDSTDNCGAATTAFMALVNSYAGSGFVNLFIQGSGSGKGYKLSTCALQLLGPAGTGGIAGSVNVISNATIDCAQSSGPCIQMGKTACSTSTFYGTGCHDVSWRGGTIIGCVNTTACMEVEQGMYINVIDDVNFNNTGAGNATIGNCTNFSVIWKTFIGGQEFSRNRFWGNVTGQCFSSNNDTTGGANTIIFTNNVISHAPAASCGSLAHYDSSAHSTIDNNTIYGFSSTLTLASNGTGGGGFLGDGGWMISGNNFDYSQSCAGNGGVQAEIQYSGTTNNVGTATIINNNVQTSPFIDRAFGSTVSMVGWTVFGNNTYNTAQDNLFGSVATGACLAFGTGASYGCYLGANPGFSQNFLPAGTPFSGWITLQGNNGHLYSGTLGANQGSTAINGSVGTLGGTYAVHCQVVLTRAATTSSTLPSCVIGWTDLLTSVAETATLTSTSAANTAGTQTNGIIYITASGNINVTTTGFASSGGTSMQYSTFTDISRVF